jgi:hypothetical protein
LAELKGLFEITADGYFKDTRARYCLNVKCDFHGKREHGADECLLKSIGINKNGICTHMTKVKE